jgi:hypothetical protein
MDSARERPILHRSSGSNTDAQCLISASVTLQKSLELAGEIERNHPDINIASHWHNSPFQDFHIYAARNKPFALPSSPVSTPPKLLSKPG